MKTNLGILGLALGLMLMTAGAAHAGTVYVKADAKGANTGGSWTDAYTDLQAALSAATWGDEIWVAAGTYKPTKDTDRNKSFALVAGAALYGGFLGNEKTKAQRDWKAHETILSGDIGTPGGNTDNSYHVVTGAYLAALDGFTISNGNSTLGGGMYNDNATSLTVTNCFFSGNTAGQGGGMYNTNTTSLKVTNCIFSGNPSKQGGGMNCINTTSLTVTNCHFNNNSATATGGGGIYFSGGSINVTECNFSNNSAYSQGGGIYCDFGPRGPDDLTVVNCSFTSNTAGGKGGGGISNNGLAIVANSIFSGNMATSKFMGFGFGGGGIYNEQGNLMVTNSTFTGNAANDSGGGICSIFWSPIVTNCILWNNRAASGAEICLINPQFDLYTFRDCDIRGCGGSGALWNPALGIDGGGNIMGDPLFVNSAHPAGPDGIWMTADDGLRLQTKSPCINAGDPSGSIAVWGRVISLAPAADILNNKRTGSPDIGAYEYQAPKNRVSIWVIYP